MISGPDAEKDSQSSSTVQDLLLVTSKQGSISLDLSKRGLNEIPYDFPICPKLECLYLEGNSLCTIPNNLSIKCPSLNWLDLRNNNITTLPPEISKLRNLKTLLLEGNELNVLPPELGLLQRLNGLSLTGNPLQSPPSYIVSNGTQAVLQYLRSQIEGNEDSSTGGESSGDDCDDNYHKQRTLTAQRLLKYSNRCGSANQSFSLRQATLHCSLDQQKRKQEHIASLLSSMDKLKRSARVKTRRRLIKKPHPLIRPELDPIERAQVTETLEREKNKQCLDDWREDAKKKQDEARRKENDSTTVIVSSAPYATEDSVSRPPLIDKEDQSENEESVSGTMTEWMKDYVKQLQYNREVTTGLTSDGVSGDLLNAETKLAGALAIRKKFETDHNREYRLRAFTGDSLF